ARIDRTRATLSHMLIICGNKVLDNRTSDETLVISRSLGCRGFGLKSQQSGALIQPPISIRIRFRAVARGFTFPAAFTFSGQTMLSAHVPAKAAPPHLSSSRRDGMMSIKRFSLISAPPNQ